MLTKFTAAAAAAAIAASLAAAPASAAVLYEFTSSFGSFSYSSSDYVTADRFVPAASFASCTAVGGTCNGARFDVDYENRGQSSTLEFSRSQQFGGITTYHYFALGAFGQNGTYTADPTINPGTLRVSGFAEPAGAVPEPGTWALLILGFGAVGAAMRSARRGRVSVSYA